MQYTVGTLPNIWCNARKRPRPIIYFYLFQSHAPIINVDSHSISLLFIIRSI